jgi:hypothetical protein
MMLSDDLTGARKILESRVTVREILAYLQTDYWMSKRSGIQYSGVGIKKIEKAIRTCRLRSFTVGKKILLRKSDIDAWIMAGEVTPQNREVEKTSLQKLTDRALEQARANVARRGE